MELRNVYETRKVVTEPGGPSKTHQSHTESCDIKKIISKFDNVGYLRENLEKAGSYVDVRYLQSRPAHQHLLESREKARKAALDIKQELADKALAEKQTAEAQAKELAELKAKLQSLDSTAP